MCEHMCACTCVCEHVCVYVCVCLHVHVYRCIQSPGIILYHFHLVLFLLYYVYGYLSVCISVYHLCTRYPQRPGEGIGCPRTGVTDSCEQPRRCHKSSLDPLEEQPMLLTTVPSLKAQIPFIFLRQSPTEHEAHQFSKLSKSVGSRDHPC